MPSSTLNKTLPSPNVMPPPTPVTGHASSNSSASSQQLSTDYLKQVLVFVDKKLRNLEKRKAKLDTYRLKEEKGEVLNDDQKKATLRYEEVVHELEFCHDMQKHVNGCQAENARALKRNSKREQQERQHQDAARVEMVWWIQEVLWQLNGIPEVRTDFLEGKNGAVKMEAAAMDQLMDLFNLFYPLEPAGYGTQHNVSHATANGAKHMCALLDGQNKEIFGTTYKALKNVLDEIINCGYFADQEQVAQNTEEEADVIKGVVADNASDNAESVHSEEHENVKADLTAEQAVVGHSEIVDQKRRAAEQVEEAMEQAIEKEMLKDADEETSPALEEEDEHKSDIDFLQESTIDTIGVAKSGNLDKGTSTEENAYPRSGNLHVQPDLQNATAAGQKLPAYYEEEPDGMNVNGVVANGDNVTNNGSDATDESEAGFISTGKHFPRNNNNRNNANRNLSGNKNNNYRPSYIGGNRGGYNNSNNNNNNNGYGYHGGYGGGGGYGNYNRNNYNRGGRRGGFRGGSKQGGGGPPPHGHASYSRTVTVGKGPPAGGRSNPNNRQYNSSCSSSVYHNRRSGGDDDHQQQPAAH